MTGLDLLLEALVSTAGSRRRAQIDVPLTLFGLLLGSVIGVVAANHEGSPEQFIGMLAAPALFTFAVGLVLGRRLEGTLRAALLASGVTAALAAVLAVAGLFSSLPF